MADTPSILIVKPGAMGDDARKALADAGVIIVEAADPSDARLITPEPLPVSGSDMLYAALGALLSTTNTVPAYNFVQGVHAAMKAAKRAQQQTNPGIVRGPGGRFVKAPSS